MERVLSSPATCTALGTFTALISAYQLAEPENHVHHSQDGHDVHLHLGDFRVIFGCELPYSTSPLFCIEFQEERCIFRLTFVLRRDMCSKDKTSLKCEDARVLFYVSAISKF